MVSNKHAWNAQNSRWTQFIYNNNGFYRSSSSIITSHQIHIRYDLLVWIASFWPSDSGFLFLFPFSVFLSLSISRSFVFCVVPLCLRFMSMKISRCHAIIYSNTCDVSCACILMANQKTCSTRNHFNACINSLHHVLIKEWCQTKWERSTETWVVLVLLDSHNFGIQTNELIFWKPNYHLKYTTIISTRFCE